MSPRCDVIKLPDGSTAFVRHSGPAWKACATCGVMAPFLCDFPIGPGKTCDVPMCEAHAKEIGPDRQVCPKHAAAEQLEL